MGPAATRSVETLSRGLFLFPCVGGRRLCRIPPQQSARSAPQHGSGGWRKQRRKRPTLVESFWLLVVSLWEPRERHPERKFNDPPRVRETTPGNSLRTRAGATKKDQKAELKKNAQGLSPQTSIFLLIPLTTPRARREIAEAEMRRTETSSATGPAAQIGAAIWTRERR